jgi:hypothetical protein
VSGIQFKKSRGFELSADLYFQTVRAAMRALAQSHDASNLANIVTLVSEGRTGLFLAGKHTAAIERCVELSDNLLQRTAFASPNSVEFARVAEEIVQSTLDAAIREEETITRRQKIPAANDSARAGYTKVFTSSLLQLLVERREGIQKFRRYLAVLPKTPALRAGDALETKNRSDLRTQFDYLTTLAETARSHEIDVFAAYCFEQAAGIAQVLHRPEAVANLASAERLLKQTATSEEVAGLHELSLAHQRQADSLALQRKKLSHD